MKLNYIFVDTNIFTRIISHCSRKQIFLLQLFFLLTTKLQVITSLGQNKLNHFYSSVQKLDMVCKG